MFYDTPESNMSYQRERDELIAEARHEIAKRDAEIERLREIVRQRTFLLDQQMGTPCEQVRHEQEVERLRTAIKPFADIGQRLHEANQRSDQSVLIGASARFLKLEPLTGQDFVNAFLAHS